MMHAPLANELRSVEDHLAELPTKRRWARTIFTRLRRIAPVPLGARVLDIGAAGGTFAIACGELGYACIGVEPWAEARERALALGARLGVPAEIIDGRAEALPFPAHSFDVVHAASVIEHVADLGAALAEIRRVLRPGGIFWFSAASALCPWQEEIRGFPLFGWYPQAWKRSIMAWVIEARPELVAHTRTPAINWFTPGRARAILGRHGFTRVYDRWDLRGTDEGGGAHALAVRAIRRSRLIRYAADITISGCAYAAL